MEVLANTTVLMLQYIKVADQYIYTLNLYNVMYQLYQPINQSTINIKSGNRYIYFFIYTYNNSGRTYKELIRVVAIKEEN